MVKKYLSAPFIFENINNSTNYTWLALGSGYFQGGRGCGGTSQPEVNDPDDGQQRFEALTQPRLVWFMRSTGGGRSSRHVCVFVREWGRERWQAESSSNCQPIGRLAAATQTHLPLATIDFYKLTNKNLCPRLLLLGLSLTGDHRPHHFLSTVPSGL